MKHKMSLVEIAQKLRQRKPFTVQHPSERNAALKAAQVLELSVTSKKTDKGFVILPIEI